MNLYQILYPDEFSNAAVYFDQIEAETKEQALEIAEKMYGKMVAVRLIKPENLI